MNRGDWMKTRLGDDVDLLTGYPFQSKDYTTIVEGVRLLRGDNIVQGRIRWDGVKRWPSSRSTGAFAYQLRNGDVVLAMDRPWIEAGLKYAAVSEQDLPCLLVQRVARLRAGPRLDTGFLRYLIGSKEFTDHVLAVQTGTAVPHISSGQIKSFEFIRPPLDQQRAIASVLGSLDDKIELNRRMNETLETMARTLFRSWFGDFDPVRTKVEGREPHGTDTETAKLFSDKFQDSPLGKIPKGWQVARWGEIVSLKYGKSLRGYESAVGSVPVFGTNGQIGWHTEPLCDHAGIVVGRKGAYRGVHFSSSPFYVIDTAYYVEPRREIELRWAYYEMLELDINSMDSGSAIPSTSRDDFYALPVVVPRLQFRSGSLKS